MDVFFNGFLLQNIHDSVSSHDIHCNAGVATVNKVWDFPGYGTVWFHPDGIANILSLAHDEEKYRVTFNSIKGNKFVVHKQDGSKQVFVESNHWLYFADVIETGCLFNTTAGIVNINYKYSNRDYSKAALARKIQQIIGKPRTKDFIHLVEK